MRSSAWVTRTRPCVRSVLCWSAFPLVPALGSAGSAADFAALFAGFIATTAGCDFSRPLIGGYVSSPSRRGPKHSGSLGQTRDIPDSDAIFFQRDGFFDHGRVAAPCITAPFMLPSAHPTASAPAITHFRGSIAHPHSIAVYA